MLIFTRSSSHSSPSLTIYTQNQVPPHKKYKKLKKAAAYAAVLLVAAVITTVIVVPVVVVNKGGSKVTHGEPFFASTAAVAADNAVCSTVGKHTLLAGGHAVDAAISTALCQGVLNPFASGIGGGGVMVIYTNNPKSDELEFEIIDMRETAPKASTYDMFFNDPSKSITGPLAIAVPGELKGLYTAWERHGKLPWADLVIPAATLAENFTVQPLLAQSIAETLQHIFASPDLTAVYAPDGVPLKAGDICRNPKLAATLTRIANEGVDVFYNGDMGRALANDVLEAGGILTFEDLQNYSVVFRQPVSTYYQGYKMILPPPPYGGLVVALTLNILERFDIGQLGYNSDSMHWLVEALKFGFSDRMAIGDPDFVPQGNVQSKMLDKDHAAILRQRLNASRTYPPVHYLDLTNEIINVTDHGTTHLSVVDGDRNAVSFTTTVNYVFGSRFVSKSTGILLNDEMDDFAVSNTSNVWDLPPSKANIIQPGKRPLSSMNPSMVFKDNKLFMLAGANGGPLIISSTLQTYLNVLTFGKDLYTAVEDPRLYVSFVPPAVAYESKFPSTIVKGLENKGNTMVVKDFANAVQAILVQADNTLLAMSDSRKQGKPDGEKRASRK